MLDMFYNIEKKQFYYRPCYSRKDHFPCKQVTKTNSFAIYQTGQVSKMFHQLNCYSQIWHHQYVGKSKTTFNFGVTSHNKISEVRSFIFSLQKLSN